MDSPTHHRKDIQGLRAIAVALVVAYHANLPVPGGFVGVDVFFVISGFVITSMLHREWTASGNIDFKRFYQRRFQRLIPALALLVSFTAVASALILPPVGAMQIAAKTEIGAMLISANYMIASTTGGYFDAPAQNNPLLNTWSLSVEEQFYIVFPIVLLFGWQFQRRADVWKQAPLIFVGILTVMSFALAIGLFTVPLLLRDSWLSGFYSPLTRIWEFAAGALLALTANKWSINRRLALAMGLAGIVFVTISAWIITDSTPFPSHWTILPVSGSMLLIIAGLNSQSMISRLISASPMVKLGDYSYSIYLWHWPFIVFATYLWPAYSMAALAAAILSLVPAVASYQFVEQPLRQLRTRSWQWTAALIAITMTVPIFFSCALLVASNNGFWMSSIQHHQSTVVEKHTGNEKGCFLNTNKRSGMSDFIDTPQECSWNTSKSGPPIYLVGDSHADHFSDGVITAGQLLDRPTFSYSKSSCPFFDLFIRNPLMSDPGVAEEAMFLCREYYESTFKWLLASPSGTVIIGAANHYWTFPGILIGSAKNDLSTDPEITSNILIDGLRRTITSLEKAGHKVVVPLTIPTYGYPYIWPMQTCNVWAITSKTCNLEMPLDFALKGIEKAHVAIQQAVIGTNATVMDLSSVLCPEGTCGKIPEVSWSLDGLHITAATSRYIAPEFVRVLLPR